MADVDFQQLSTVQSGAQPKPNTIAATTTIAPTSFVTFISGSTAIATITPFVSGAHMLCLIFTATNGATTTTGNINAVVTPVQNIPVFLVFDPNTAKYFAGNVKTN